MGFLILSSSMGISTLVACGCSGNGECASVSFRNIGLESFASIVWWFWVVKELSYIHTRDRSRVPQVWTLESHKTQIIILDFLDTRRETQQL